MLYLPAILLNDKKLCRVKSLVLCKFYLNKWNLSLEVFAKKLKDRNAPLDLQVYIQTASSKFSFLTKQSNLSTSEGRSLYHNILTDIINHCLVPQDARLL